MEDIRKSAVATRAPHNWSPIFSHRRNLHESGAGSRMPSSASKKLRKRITKRCVCAHLASFAHASSPRRLARAGKRVRAVCLIGRTVRLGLDPPQTMCVPASAVCMHVPAADAASVCTVHVCATLVVDEGQPRWCWCCAARRAPPREQREAEAGARTDGRRPLGWAGKCD